MARWPQRRRITSSRSSRRLDTPRTRRPARYSLFERLPIRTRMQPMSGDEGRMADADTSAPAARYTKGVPRRPVRRQEDTLGPQTRAPGQPARKVGGRLRNEILIPVGIGSFAGFASLGVIAAGVSQVGLPVAPIVGGAALALIAALLVYVAWIVNGAAIRPLEDVRTALREMEEGNYDVRLDPIGSAELAELMEGFN